MSRLSHRKKVRWQIFFISQSSNKRRYFKNIGVFLSIQTMWSNVVLERLEESILQNILFYACSIEERKKVMQVWNSFVWQCKHTKMPVKEVQTNLWFVSNCTYTNWLVTVIDVHTVCKQKIIHVWVTGASQMLCFFLSGNGADVNI